MPVKLYPPGTRDNPRYWYAKGRVAGRHVEFSTEETDKDRAQIAAGEIVKRLAEGGPAPKRRAVTFAYAADAYMAFKAPPKDDQRRIGKLVAALGAKKVRDIVHADLVTAADLLYPALKPSARNRNVITPASAILHYAAENGWCEWKRIKRFKEARPETRAIPKAAANLLIANAEGKVRLLLIVLFGSGLRITDALQITWDDIDLPAGTVRVRVGKTDRWRVFPLDPVVAAALANEPTKEGRLFPWRTRWGAYKPLRALRKKIASRFTPHMARHSLGTWLNAAGAGLKTIMATLGHDDPKSSMRYQDADIEIVRAGQRLVGDSVGTGKK